MKTGFVLARQKRSHVFLRHTDGKRTVAPIHEEVSRSTLMDIIDQIKLTKKEFLTLVRNI